MKLFGKNRLAFAVLDAMYTSDLERLRQLQQHGLRFDVRSPTGETYLHRIAAVPTAHADEVAECLIAWGADVGAVTKEQFQPLHFAAINGNVRVAEVLLQYGAAINAVTEYGFTPLHYAVSHDQDAFVSLLLHRGANPQLKTLAGETPLDIAYRNEAWDIAGLFWNLSGAPQVAGSRRTVFIPSGVAALH
jgi:ankyrin